MQILKNDPVSRSRGNLYIFLDFPFEAFSQLTGDDSRGRICLSLGMVLGNQLDDVD